MARSATTRLLVYRQDIIIGVSTEYRASLMFLMAMRVLLELFCSTRSVQLHLRILLFIRRRKIKSPIRLFRMHHAHRRRRLSQRSRHPRIYHRKTLRDVHFLVAHTMRNLSLNFTEASTSLV